MNHTGRTKTAPRVKSLILEEWGQPAVLQRQALPPGLSGLPNAPERAFLWGALPPSPWVSIVGTRSPTKQGFLDAFHLARRLSRAGVTIASGGASGIDSAAHLGALAARGATIVIAPTWLPYAYPISNHRLFQRILRSGGAYLTVAEENTRPMKFAFFRRNEVLMALSHATVLGECPLQSGAKNAMLHARKLGRPRFALPFRFGDKRALGVWNEIMQQGAELLAEETPLLRLLEEYGEFENSIWCGHMKANVLAAPADAASPLRLCAQTPKRTRTGSSSRTSPRSNAICDSRPESEKLVLSSVLRGQVTVDALCAATALPPEEVQYLVCVLMLSGELAEDEQGLLRFQRSTPL